MLGDMPQKTFEFTRRAEETHPLDLPSTATPEGALERVLRLPAVASKRFLTTKVDRCVTGAALVCSTPSQQALRVPSETHALPTCAAL